MCFFCLIIKAGANVGQPSLYLWQPENHALRARNYNYARAIQQTDEMPGCLFYRGHTI